MSEERFSFRWGIPWLDADFMQVPHIFFDHYVEAGATRVEFLCFLHLARFKFESARGRSRPSLSTIAKQMGVTVREVQYLIRSLEDKGLLIITAIPGQPNDYCFENFARVCWRLAEKAAKNFTPEENFTPTPEENFTPPMKKTSPEEQETRTRRQQQQAVDVVSVNVLKSAGEEMLEKIGVHPEAAARLAKQFPLGRIWEIVDAARHMEGLRNPAAWVATALVRNYSVATTPEEKKGNTGLEASVISCAWRKNKSLGPCPVEENGSPWMPWCRVCDHAVAIAASAHEK